MSVRRGIINDWTNIILVQLQQYGMAYMFPQNSTYQHRYIPFTSRKCPKYPTNPKLISVNWQKHDERFRNFFTKKIEEGCMC